MIGTSQRRNAGRVWLFSRLLPATSILVLLIWQVTALVRESSGVLAHPALVAGLSCLRSVLYVMFLSIPIIAFLAHDPPTASDERMSIEVVAIAATFLLVLLGFVPSGPVIFLGSLAVEAAAFSITLLGVMLAVAAAANLGMNFSFRPEARRLVLSGPYRLVRHPVYLAELLMSSGVLVADPRLTMVFGECALVVLQIVRIGAEERLLGVTFPEFEELRTTTRYRLIPGVW